MKSKYSVIITWALLCCVPAVVFFLFRDENDGFGTYIAPVTTTWPVEQQNTDYEVSVEPATPPLKQGKQVMILDVQPRESEVAAAAPVVEIVMPMGKEIMTAPVSLAKRPKQPGQYAVETYFSMAGEWQLLVKPQPASAPIQLDFIVEP